MKRSIEEQLLNPKPGSKAAAAKEFGIDLTLLIEQLRLTPEERLRDLQQMIIGIEKMRAGIERHKNNDDSN